MSNEYIDRILSWMSDRYNKLYESTKKNLTELDIQRLRLILGFLFLIALVSMIYPLSSGIFRIAIAFGWQLFLFCSLLAIIIFLCIFVFMVFISGSPIPLISFSHEYVTQIGGQLKSLADLIELCSTGDNSTNGEWLKDKLIMLKQARNNINMEIENTVKDILDKIPKVDDIPEILNKPEEPT